MSARYLAASAAVTAVVVLTVWITNLSFQRAILLAPVLVIGVAALAGLIVFWGKVGWESVRGVRHPRLLVVGVVAFFALVALLTVLGVNLPKE